MKMNFNRPAAGWREGCPLGNGHMGAMYYGGIGTDRIDLSEQTFFSGEPSDETNRENAKTAFYKMRKSVCEGDYEACDKEAKNFIGRRKNYGSNLPVGQMLVEYEKAEAAAADVRTEETGMAGTRLEDICTDYSRTLDYKNGLAGISYTDSDGFPARREIFVSNPDRALYMRITTQSPDGLCFRVRFDNGDRTYTPEADGENGYRFLIRAHEKLHSDGRSGVTLLGRISVFLPDGNGAAAITVSGRGVHVERAKDVIIMLRMWTDFEECLLKKPQKERKECLYQKAEGQDQILLCKPEGRDGLLPQIPEAAYEEAKKKHTEDVSGFMGRVALSLKADKTAERMLQFGRYLLLCSSREDSPLPAHLQGAWNDNVACRIGWTCDMHLDINTQMNYWLAEPAALPECIQPLFRWMEEILIPSGRKSAAVNYGLDGWCAELVSNAWGFSAPYWAKPLSPCPTGGIWTASAYPEHYLFTGDRDFLEKRAYPVLKEAVEFFSEYVFREKGHYTCGPSISPENSFVKDGTVYYASNGCTYELTMIRELFTSFLSISEELGRNELTEKVKTLLYGLLPFRVLPDGTLAEFGHDYPAADPQHRHTSHLLGLYPYAQITPEETPELAQAARKSIGAKLTPYENWEDTGWARTMLMMYSARLKDGEGAYRHLSEMMNRLLFPNGMVKHPPTRGASSFDDVYELDGNTGSAACILEMLLQSHNGVIEFLPALPAKWADGTVSGLRARGGVRVDMSWRDGKLLQAALTAEKEGTYRLKWKQKIREMYLPAGEPLKILGVLFWESYPSKIK